MHSLALTHYCLFSSSQSLQLLLMGLPQSFDRCRESDRVSESTTITWLYYLYEACIHLLQRAPPRPSTSALSESPAVSGLSHVFSPFPAVSPCVLSPALPAWRHRANPGHREVQILVRLGIYASLPSAASEAPEDEEKDLHFSF